MGGEVCVWVGRGVGGEVGVGGWGWGGGGGGGGRWTKTHFCFNTSRTTENREKCFCIIEFIIELVTLASLIASMTQNKFSSIFLKNLQLLHCQE